MSRVTQIKCIGILLYPFCCIFETSRTENGQILAKLTEIWLKSPKSEVTAPQMIDYNINEHFMAIDIIKTNPRIKFYRIKISKFGVFQNEKLV